MGHSDPRARNQIVAQLATAIVDQLKQTKRQPIVSPHLRHRFHFQRTGHQRQAGRSAAATQRYLHKLPERLQLQQQSEEGLHLSAPPSDNAMNNMVRLLT